MSPDWHESASFAQVALRLVVAIIIGGVIGWDRQRSEKPAGMRTHMLVSLGSASFTLLGFEVGVYLPEHQGAGFDPTRVLQGVIGGIGFLGAGAIIRNQGRVSGITTAASVWVAGAMGAAAGTGAFTLALITTVLTFLVLTVVDKLEQRTGHRERSDSEA